MVKKSLVAMLAAIVGLAGLPEVVAAASNAEGRTASVAPAAVEDLPEPPPVDVPEASVQHPVTPGAAEPGKSLDEEPMVEVESLRDATSRTFEHPGGARTIDAYTSPINYRDEDGVWQPIDNTLRESEDRPGWLTNHGNDFAVSFGPIDEGVELGVAGDQLRMTPLRSGQDGERSAESPRAAEAPGPTVAQDDDARPAPVPKSIAELADRPAMAAPSVATYADVWPNVDISYELSGSGLKEDVVIRSPDAPTEYSFRVEGPALHLNEDGGLRLEGPLGERFRVPPPAILDQAGSDVTSEAKAAFGLADDPDGYGATVLTVSVDPAWMASLPVSSFPLRLDPSFIILEPTAGITFIQSGGSATGLPISIGRHAASGLTFRAGLYFNQYEPYVSGNWRIYNAMLSFAGHNSPPDPEIIVYDQGSQPTSFGSIGTAVPVAEGDWFGPFKDVSKTMDEWLSGNLSNRWFGVRSVETGDTFRNVSVQLTMTVFQPPEPSYVVNLAPGQQQVLATTTPQLQSAAVPFAPDDPDQPPYHEFRVTTSPSPDAGLVLSSGMIEQPSPSTGVSWTVPSGSLVEGVSYWAWVLTDFPQYGGPPPPTMPTEHREFIVDLGLGDGGPSPTDEVGSVPGQAATPSEGAPSPSLPGSKVTVNMVDGNLSATFGTRTMATVAGPLALAFTYNSLGPGNQGLRAEYYNDTNDSGQIDAGDAMVAQRIDPTVSFNWGYGVLAKPVAAIDPTRALARWTGNLTVPSSTTRTWQLGAISSDGLRASIDGQPVLDRWTAHEPESEPVFGASFDASNSQPLPIMVEWRNSAELAVAQVFLRDVTEPWAPVTYALSSDWLTHNTSILPQGWTLNAAAGSGRWVGLADRGTSVSAFAADGSAHEFIAADDGSYQPPLEAPNDLLAVAEDGRFVLRDSGGNTYTFRPDGALESLVSAADDRTPAALEYTYSGTPLRLRTITDPVSERSVELFYGGDTACDTVPGAAIGLLCQIDFWDDETTDLTYDSSGRLIQVRNPGDIRHDLQYENANWPNHLSAIRDPLANDTVDAGVRDDDNTTFTHLIYYADGRIFLVWQPEPMPGSTNTFRMYMHDTVNRTAVVHVGGFSPSTGWAQQVEYDLRNRIVRSTRPDGLSTTYQWDDLDRLIATTDPTGLRTTTHYDHASRPVHTYGPAPTSHFDVNGLPVTPGTMPTTTSDYDEGILGLAAAYWTNPYLAGGPETHATGPDPSGNLSVDWGTTPPVTAGPGGWSARLSGYMDVAAGAWEFQVSTKGSEARVWIGNQLAVEFDGPEPPAGWASANGDPITLPAGWVRIRVDMVDTTGESGIAVAARPAGSGSFTVVPGTTLTPNYGLVTSSADADGLMNATEYDDPITGIGPHHGLPTATIVDPGGLDLRTSITYETPGPGSYLRRNARTLPAGNTWTTDNYGGTEGPIAAVCDVGGIPQGGFPKRITGPDPDGAGPERARVEEFVYDEIGREVGRRAGDASTISTAGWACTTHDARGRIATRSWPAHNGATARTLTHTYAVGNDPLVNSLTDTDWPSANVMATVDLLGRTISYRDIHGNTTTTEFDTPGRMTSATGPLGTITQNYDPDNGRPTTTVINGITAATPAYDTTGRLESVAYLNNAVSIYAYDTHGRPSATGIIDAAGVTGDVVTRSLAGRVIDQSVWDGSGSVDANPTGDNFAYDSAGRLTNALLPGATYAYGFGAATGCDVANAGDNTNRTSLTITGVGATSSDSCYDHADRLTSSTGIAPGEVTYDDRGNTTRLGDERLVFDSANRHVATHTPDAITKHLRDPLDRIVERRDSSRITHVATTTATAGANAVTVTRPPGTQTGDLIVASIATNDLGQPGQAASAGWTVARSQANLLNRTTVLWRYATGSDPASWTFTTSGLGPLGTSTGALSTYRATAGATPVATTAANSALLSINHPVPQVTTTTDATQVVHVAGFSGATTASPPTGSDQRAVVSAEASLLVADRPHIDPGTSPAGSVSTSAPFSSASVTIAISAVTTRSLTGHDGHSDRPQLTTTPTGDTLDFTIPLVGGALFTWNATDGYALSHTNWHGDTITVTDISGNRVWNGLTGPHGEQASSTVPTNTALDGTRWGWHAADQRLTDRTITQMGARPYSAAHGRFLTVDPIEGGCANDYVYVHGDPLNTDDIYGEGWFDWVPDCPFGKNPNGSCRGSGAARNVLGCAGTVFSAFAPWGSHEGAVFAQLGALTASPAAWALSGAIVAGTVTVGSAVAVGIPLALGGAAFVVGMVMLLSDC